MFKLKIDDKIELRMVEISDSKHLYNLINDNRIRLEEWFDWPYRVQSESDAKEYINYIKRNIGLLGHMHCSIWSEDVMIGMISHQQYNASNNSVCIGYWLDQKYEGKGIMTRVVEHMVSYAFYISINKVEIYCAVENDKSSRIPEKLGFVKEGLIRNAERLHGKYIDNYIYGMLSKDWLKD